VICTRKLGAALQKGEQSLWHLGEGAVPGRGIISTPLPAGLGRGVIVAKPGDPSPPAFSEICIVSAKRILAAEGSDRQTGRQIRPSEKGRNVMHLTLCRAQTG